MMTVCVGCTTAPKDPHQCPPAVPNTHHTAPWCQSPLRCCCICDDVETVSDPRHPTPRTLTRCVCVFSALWRWLASASPLFYVDVIMSAVHTTIAALLLTTTTSAIQHVAHGTSAAVLCTDARASSSHPAAAQPAAALQQGCQGPQHYEDRGGPKDWARS